MYCARHLAGRLSLLLLCWFALAGPVAAATDAARSKDHPLLTRYPNSHIAEYTKNFDGVAFAVSRAADGSPVRRRIEGDLTNLVYFHNDGNRQPSPLELIRNYQNAVKAIGGEVVYERLPRDNDGGETTLKVSTGGKDVWVMVEPGIFSAPTQSYRLAVVEVAAMQQVVSANRMLDEINRNGYIALYVNFDTNKADLKPDGQATVREIVAMLKAAPALKLSVEGHTDNVGTPAANKLLSEQRARSVMTAVVAGGIAANRLGAAGYGAERPIADNRSDDGRAKNRRVELVKQ